ncbi:MAG: MMPL family transporter [Candidatus Thiodiazotropha sp.]
MKRVITTSAQHPWLVIAVLAAITLFAATYLPRLRIEISATGMMVDHADAVAEYEQSLRTFGSDTITVIYLEDEDLFKPGKLSAIKEALTSIEAIPQVSYTTSLFSVRYLRSENGYIYTGPYFEAIPESLESANKIVEASQLNPLIERNLLSRDGTVMAINVYLEASKYEHGFDDTVSSALDEAIAPLRRQVRHAFHLGNTSIRSEISNQVRNDISFILPLSIISLALTLWIILKRPVYAVIPLLTAGLSTIWTLGLMAALSIPINIMTSIIPALLIVIGSTEDIHLITEYQAGVRGNIKRPRRIGALASNMGTAILLTFITTCVGFLSISLNRIELLQQFGLMTAAGLSLNFIITVMLVPACLQLTASHRTQRSIPAAARLYQCMEKILGASSRHPKTMISGLLLVMFVNGYWATKIEVNNNVMSYLPSTSSLPEKVSTIRDKLSGIQSLTILVSGQDEAFLKIANIRQLQKLQHYLEQTGQADKSFSFADFISVVHSGIDGEAPDKIYLPERDEIVSSYMSLLGHASAKAFISPDYNQARIVVRHAIDDSKKLNEVVEDILRFADISLEPSLLVKVTGSSYLNSQATDHMADGQTQSLMMMLVIIFLLISFLLANATIGLIAVLSNIFPIIVLFGVMGYFGIALDTGTVMVAAIALGICVDHTMHFVARYQRLVSSGVTQCVSLRRTLRQESIPILTTAFALCVGFAVLSLSSFPPVAQFGRLSALVMLLALIGTFVVTPLLLHLTFHNTRTTALPEWIQRNQLTRMVSRG